MCFAKAPPIPAAPPVPSKESQDAKARRANEAVAAQQEQGRAATIITSPLGVSDFGQNVNRTKLGGM